jgi:hypothetical protein
VNLFFSLVILIAFSILVLVGAAMSAISISIDYLSGDDDGQE